MTRSERHSTRKTFFFKAYLAYLIIIAIALAGIFIYVRNLMVKYENNSPENYVVWLAEKASPSSELGKYLEEKNFSDTRFGIAGARKDNFYNTIKAAKLEAKAAKGSYGSLNPVYDVTADGNPFMTIALKELSNTTKLGIMTLSDWDIDYCILRDPYSNSDIKLNENGSLDYKLVVPEGFSLFLDGAPAVNLDPVSEITLPDFQYVADYVDAPKGKVYELSNVYYEPNFTAANNGGETLAFEKQIDGGYSVKAEYSASPEAKALADSVCDPMEIAKLWSKFMTDDVGGASHGLATVRTGCKLLQGTNLYDLATKWASNVDITFVSGHTLDGWSNESVDNYVQYNQNLFSCDVYVEKNMTISRGLGPRTDVFSNRMFFGNVNGTWYLLDMVTLDK